MEEHAISFGAVRLDLLDERLDHDSWRESLVPLLIAYLQETYASTAFYRQRFDRAGCSPKTIQSLSDFEKLPPLLPQDVSSVSELALLPDRYRVGLEGASALRELPFDERLCRRFTTTSTTGRPKVAYYTVADWSASCANNLRQHRHVSFAKLRRVFNCFHPAHIGGRNVEDSFHRLGSIVVNRAATAINDEDVIRQLYAELADLGGFTCMALAPRSPATKGPSKGPTLDNLLNVDVDNYIGRKIQCLTLGGIAMDLPGSRLRDRVWEANDLAGAERTSIVEKYGCSEVGGIAAECELNDGLHLTPGFTYTEVVDASGRHVQNGERGLVLTTGFKHGSRFLRYVVGDEATYVTDRCRCGRSTPRLFDFSRVLEPERLLTGCAAGGFTGS